MKELATKSRISLQVANIGSMFGFFFNENPVKNFTDAKASNIPLFQKFFHLMLERGVYFAPSAFEAGFIGLHHDSKCIDQVLDKVSDAFKNL
jgi:glutamate-1-semialdehyde 2,1-aminomutase